MDGVLVDSNPYHRQAWTSYAKALGKSIDQTWLSKHVFGRINRDALSALLGRVPTDEELAQHSANKEALFLDLFTPNITLLAGLETLLPQAKAAGIPMAVATSAPRMNVEFVFDRLGLSAFFEVVIDEEMIERGKPDPEIYLKAAKALAIRPEDCLVFEDSFSGVQAGLAAGMPVIALSTTHKSFEFNEVEKVIKDFRDFSLEDWWDGGSYD